MRGPIGWITGALIGGTLGAAIWAAIGHFTGYEVGWIAWLVGVLVGLGTAVLGKEGGMLPGIIAAIVAILAVGIGKFAVVNLAVDGAFAQIDTSATDQDAISLLADDIVEKREAAGQTIDWPDTDSEAISDSYPADIWQEALASWNRMPPADQQAWIDHAQYQYRTNLQAYTEDVKAEVFSESFTPFDLLWLLLAVASAFKLGSGMGGDDE